MGILQEGELDSEVEAEDGLRCIFVTASPVLTAEVEKYCHKVSDRIMDRINNQEKQLKGASLKKDTPSIESALLEVQFDPRNNVMHNLSHLPFSSGDEVHAVGRSPRH